MVYIKIDTGSRAKGYANSDSDFDYFVYKKCDREVFEEFVFNKHQLKCEHMKDDAGNDVRVTDLCVALYGVFSGKTPELGIFLKPDDCKDKYGQLNEQLYQFIKKLTIVCIVKIVKRMIRPNVPTTAKALLRLMFDCAFTEYYLDFKKLPDSTKILNMLLNLDDFVDLATDGADRLLVNGRVVSISKGITTKIDDKVTITIKNVDKLRVYAQLVQRGECREEWRDFFKNWLRELSERLAHVPEPPRRADVLHSIVMYALNERGPVMPEDENNILCQIYPSISHLDRQKKGVLANKRILVQEKLDGCNYRVIVDKGVVTYGSRNTYQPDVAFMNVHRISAQLEAYALKLKPLMAPDESFVVYGELLGWRDEARTKPINEIAYTQQKESLKYYAYEIQSGDGAFVPFEEAQLRLRAAGFDTIPFCQCLYNEFVKGLHFNSQMFPKSPLEGYIIRCGKLIYKLKSNYKDLNKLQIESGPFDALNCDELNKECAVDGKLRGPFDALNCDELNKECAVDGKLSFTDLLRHCYTKFECKSCDEKQLFNKLYYLYRERFNFDHKDYKALYAAYCVDVCNNVKQ
ncbi:HE65 [Philosamia cynthia ricini nucleopolyhedrovirus virus]|nr:HE65 [Philosamia cynthia ricini nucleopolyhedrovirus virus]